MSGLLPDEKRAMECARPPFTNGSLQQPAFDAGWIAARAHYAAAVDDANAESSRLEDDRTEAREQADALANALDCFFYDLRFTAPEAISMRLNQLGDRITGTMAALGYPKKGVQSESEDDA
jgi:hypothetical protein